MGALNIKPTSGLLILGGQELFWIPPISAYAFLFFLAHANVSRRWHRPLSAFFSLGVSAIRCNAWSFQQWNRFARTRMVVSNFAQGSPRVSWAYGTFACRPWWKHASRTQKIMVYDVPIILGQSWSYIPSNPSIKHYILIHFVSLPFWAWTSPPHWAKWLVVHLKRCLEDWFRLIGKAEFWLDFPEQKTTDFGHETGAFFWGYRLLVTNSGPRLLINGWFNFLGGLLVDVCWCLLLVILSHFPSYHVLPSCLKWWFELTSVFVNWVESNSRKWFWLDRRTVVMGWIKLQKTIIPGDLTSI